MPSTGWEAEPAAQELGIVPAGTFATVSLRKLGQYESLSPIGVH